MADVLGKNYAGQRFVPVVSADDVAEGARLKEEYEVEGSIPLEAWFSIRGHRDPVMKAAMAAFTKVRRTTPAKWDEIFKDF